MKPLLLAIETGGTKIQLVLGTSAGDICYRYRTLVDREKGMQGILDKVLEAFPLLEQEAAKLGGKIECAGIDLEDRWIQNPERQSGLRRSMDGAIFR